jgi:glutathione S-transferase
MPPLLLKQLFTRMPKRAPALLRAKSPWFAGTEFTAADIQMSFPLEAAAARGGLEQGHPHAMAFLERIHARPAYQRALERGGPYAVGR